MVSLTWNGALFHALELSKPFWKKLALVEMIVIAVWIMDVCEKFGLEFSYLKMLLGKFVRRSILKVFLIPLEF